MSGADVAALIVACLASALVGALVIVLLALNRTLRDARSSIDALRSETLAAIEELRASARRAEFELDRIDALYSTAEALSGTADSASRLAYRTVSNPVVKAIAIGAGTRKAIRRLRSDDS